MKKYLVIGNPVDHSLSPKLHNYWFKKNNIHAVYEKKKINKEDIKDIIFQARKGNLDGINVTTPFKNSVIPFLDQISPLATETQSVNTIYKKDNKIIGHNTDVGGFEFALKHIKYEVKNKEILVLGAGGVVSSIVVALKKMKASKIILSNRTKEKAEKLKKNISGVEVINWGETPNFDMIINATSLGLKKDDQIKIDFSSIGLNKLFYDIIYNPKQTEFLSKAKGLGNKTENGKIMFIYQARQAFNIWHKILPTINNETIKLLD